MFIYIDIFCKLGNLCINFYFVDDKNIIILFFYSLLFFKK